MRQILLLPLAAPIGYAGILADSRRYDAYDPEYRDSGYPFRRVEREGGMKILRVDNNLSSVTNTAADAFRQLPSVITDMEGAVTYRAPVMSGCLSMEFLTVCWKNIAVTC